MAIKDTVSRRSLLAAGIGSVATLAVGAGRASPTPPLTPANPEGPFYPAHIQHDMNADLTRVEGRPKRADGQVIHVSGRVLDQQGKPVAGALVDVWQANAHGRYDHDDDSSGRPFDPNFQYWAKMKTDADGRYSFTTIKPAPYGVDPQNTLVRPPHIHYRVARRGYQELTTQLYFSGDALNDQDDLFLSVPKEQRRLLLVDFVGEREPSGAFDVVLASVVKA